MELKYPTIIDFREFVKTGRFGFLQIGQTKEAIAKKLPLSEADYDKNIWKYGTIELHFSRNMLSLIFCDNLKYPLGNEDLIVDNWFMKNFDNNMLVVMEVLTSQNIEFKVRSDKKFPNLKDIEISQSAVRLIFIDKGKPEGNLRNCFLDSFAYSKLHRL